MKILIAGDLHGNKPNIYFKDFGIIIAPGDFGSCKIENTIAINAGFGSNVNTWLELEGNKIKKLEFYRGKYK